MHVQNVPIQRGCVPFHNTHYFSAQYLHKAYSTQKYKKYIMVTTYYPCIVKSLCKVSTPCMPSYVTQQIHFELPPRFGDPLPRRTQEAGGPRSYHGDPHQAGTGEVSNQRQLAIIWQWEPPASCLSAERFPEPCIAKPYRSARWKGRWLGSLTEHPPVLAFMEFCTHNALLPNTLVPWVKLSILYNLIGKSLQPMLTVCSRVQRHRRPLKHSYIHVQCHLWNCEVHLCYEVSGFKPIHIYRI